MKPKLLGLSVPSFEIRQQCEKHGVHAFSGNYTLYSVMLRRFHQILSQFVVRQEIYSVDVSFLDLFSISDLTTHSLKIYP